MALHERLRESYQKLEAYSSKYLLRQEFYAVLLFLSIGILALLYRGGRSLWYTIFPSAIDSATILSMHRTDSLFVALSAQSGGAHFWQSPESSSGTVADNPTPVRSKQELRSQPIILNRATNEDLEQLPGIGAVMSRRIVDYRTSRGKFRSLEELMNVEGIGPRTYSKIKPFLRLD